MCPATTPEFLLWSLEHACSVRGFENGSDPERTERQLRAARAFSEARRAGRVLAGFCLDPPFGFRIEEALRIYGGLPAVVQACQGCPANALARVDAGAVAGCYGLTPLPADSRQFLQAVEPAIASMLPAHDALFPRTSPRWYGLWIQTPLAGDCLRLLYEILTAAERTDSSARAVLAELAAAAEVAGQYQLRLHVRLYPPGVVEGPWWRLITHCPRCRAEWNNASLRGCQVCRYVGQPAPDKKRHVRGRRPYFPLARLLGEQQAAELLEQYAASREEPASCTSGGSNSAHNS